MMDAAYSPSRSKQWEPVELDEWRGQTAVGAKVELVDYDAEHILLKEEKMPDGRSKVILKNKSTGEISQRTLD